MKATVIKSLVTIGVAICMIACQGNVDCVNVPTQLLATDTIPNVKNMTDIRVYNNDVLLTYESRGSYGQQFVRRYAFDSKAAILKHKQDMFRNENGSYQFYAPILFGNTPNDLFAIEREMPSVYKITDEGQTVATSDNIISSTAKVPYPLVMEAKQVFWKAPHEYLFVGREPKDGVQVLFLSKNEEDSLAITEVCKIIYDPKQPSWITNFGKLSYNEHQQIGAFAFQMYPVIQYINIQSRETSSIRLFNAVKTAPITDGADVWELNPVYFRDIVSNGKYIYALYWGKTFQEAGKEQAEGKGFSQIYKFDWNGKLKKVYNINKCLSNICMIDADKTIIGFDGYRFYSIGV